MWFDRSWCDFTSLSNQLLAEQPIHGHLVWNSGRHLYRSADPTHLHLVVLVDEALCEAVFGKAANLTPRVGEQRGVRYPAPGETAFLVHTVRAEQLRSSLPGCR